MNPSQLHTWLKDGPKPDDLELLRECVDRYPYSGPLRMMLAKASEQASDFDRREELLRAGAHVPSRRALFAYLMGPTLVEDARAIHDEVVAAESVSEEELVQMVWHAKETAAPSHEDDNDAEDPSENAEASQSEDPASREAMVAAIASVIEQDVASWNEEEPGEPVAPNDAAPVDSSSSSGVPKVEFENVPAPQSLFGQWLQQRAEATGFGSRAKQEQGAAALIDAFLAKGDVRIGPIRESHESTEDWAKQGLIEDPSLVTETMAKLYAQQGQLGRARKAYRLLALKYPEKSVYFAAQLKKLRNT